MTTRIVIDPAGGAMQAAIGSERDGGRGWAFISFDRSKARDSEKAYSALVAALGNHCVSCIGIVGGQYGTQLTDFPTEESLIHHLRAAGVVAPSAPFEV